MVEDYSPSFTHPGDIITREDVLTLGHEPDELLYRQNEIKEIGEAIKPFLENRQSDNLLIYGDLGTGKTACITHILKRLEKRSSRVKAIYVNCWEHSTRMAIYILVTRALGEMMPRRGLARDEVYGRMVELMEKEGTRILLVLDEIDGLLLHGEGKLLDDIERAGKEKQLFLVIGISNDGRLLAQRRAEIRGSARLAGIEFCHYSMAQITDILTERAKAGLVRGSWNKEIIEACANKAIAAKSNVRVGLELLWAAAKMAEKAGRAKIEPEDVQAADERRLNKLANPGENDLKSSPMSLSDEEQLILEIVKSGPKSSTDLYLAFFKKLRRSKRQIRNYLDELEAKQLLRIQTVEGLSPILNTRVIQLNVGGESA